MQVNLDDLNTDVDSIKDSRPYLEGLNAEQEEAVLAPLNLPLKITAGAGTGKTRTLTARYVRCLAENPDWTPENLLALTFTDKASLEMKSRIIKQCRNMKLFNQDTSLLNAWIGTFHSICSRILRENALSAGCDPEFKVLTESESRAVFCSALEDLLNLEADTAGIDLYSFKQLPFIDLPRKSAAIYSIVGFLKDEFLNPVEFREVAVAKNKDFYDLFSKLPEMLKGKKINASTLKSLQKKFNESDHDFVLEEEWIDFIYLVYREYQKRLADMSAADFADLIFAVYRLLKENESLRNAYRSRFKHIFVDEFQDTSGSQFKLLSLLAVDEKMSNITVVGDEKQGIYAWRNARPENMEDFNAVFWGGKEIILRSNYRSRKGILDISHHSITRQEPFSSKGEEIRLYPGREDALQEDVHVLQCQRVDSTQALLVAKEIQRLMAEGCPPGEIAVLFRSLRYCKLFEDELRVRGIPYCTVGGTGFYDRMEIIDLLAYLKLISNPADRNSLIHVLIRPPVGLSDNLLYRLANRWEAEEGERRRLDVYEALSLACAESDMEAIAVAKLQRLRNLLDNALINRATLSASAMLDFLLVNSGYLQYLYTRPYNEVMHSMANLRKLRVMLAEYESNREAVGLDDIIRLLEIFQDNNEAEADYGEENVVQLMTVHKAKGLEYRYVFVAQVTPGRFPFPSRTGSPVWHQKMGLLIKGTLKFGDSFTPKQWELLSGLGLIYYKEAAKKDALDEDRRVFYVAVTRAKDRLYLMAGVSVKKTDLPDYYNELGEVIEEAPFDKYCISCAVDQQENYEQGGNPDIAVKDEYAFERALLAAQKNPAKSRLSADKVTPCNELLREAALRSIIKDIADKISKTLTSETGSCNVTPDTKEQS